MTASSLACCAADHQHFLLSCLPGTSRSAHVLPLPPLPFCAAPGTYIWFRCFFSYLPTNCFPSIESGTLKLLIGWWYCNLQIHQWLRITFVECAPHSYCGLQEPHDLASVCTARVICCHCLPSLFFFFYFYLFILIFTLFYFTVLHWFCHTLTWIHHGCIHPFAFYSHTGLLGVEFLDHMHQA